MNYSQEIALAIRNHLTLCNMHFVTCNEGGAFVFNTVVPGAFSSVQYIISIHEDAYTVIANCPLTADVTNSAVMTALSELIIRANQGLKYGNFNLDYEEGNIRYKCHADCGEYVPTDEMIQRSITVPAAMIRHYAPGFVEVLYKGASPKEALELCERYERERMGAQGQEE